VVVSFIGGVSINRILPWLWFWFWTFLGPGSWANIFITCKYIALLIFLLGIILGYHSELWVIAYDPREEPPDRQRPSGLGAGLPLQVPPSDTRQA
jgi:hypothetical protein